MSKPLERTIDVHCSIERAFELFVTEVDVWWPVSHRPAATSKLVLEASEGGRFMAILNTGEVKVMGEVLICEPPSRLVYTWFPGAINKPTRVEVRFVAMDSMTRVEVTHSEGDSELGAAWEERVNLFIRGWGAVLPAFAEYVQDQVSRNGDNSE